MAYDPPKFKNEIDLQLSRNESCCAIDDLPMLLGEQSAFVPRYPDHLALQTAIGEFVGVDADRIVVTAGGDDAIDRVMRFSITDSRKKVVCHQPSFEMIAVYAGLYGGTLDQTVWLDGDFPFDEFISRIDSETAVVNVVSPNNPTGGSISAEQILKIADAAKAAGAKLLVDYAYIEFADEDPTADLACHDNLMMVRTFSKAFGLAGLRVGYLIAPTAEFATTIRNLAGPFPVSSVSLETARRAVCDYSNTMRENIDRIVTIRGLLEKVVQQCGGNPIPSQGNFLLCKFDDSEGVWDRLVGQGIGVRKFPGAKLLENQLRITCPTNQGDFLRLAKAIAEATSTAFEPIKSDLLADLLPESSVDAAPSKETFTASTDRETKETNIQGDFKLWKFLPG
jgi:histidinol-phosphate aminotransferase